MGAGLCGKLALVPRAKKPLATVLDRSQQQPGKVRKYRDLSFLQAKEVLSQALMSLLTASLISSLLTFSFLLPFPPFIY